jgi:hypothetical protein
MEQRAAMQVVVLRVFVVLWDWDPRPARVPRACAEVAVDVLRLD